MIPTFIKTHFAITKKRFHSLREDGHYPLMPASLSIDKAVPNFNLFWLFTERVGGPWDWNLRKTYHDDRRYWEAVINHPQSRLYILRKNGAPIGYCFAGLPQKSAMTVVSDQQAALPENTIEIHNFGLFQEETGKSYGAHFLPWIFNDLFKEYDAIYLSTRNTNHKGVLHFYERMGMHILRQETFAQDLIAVSEKRQAA